MTLAWREATVTDSPLARWDARWKLAAFVLFGMSVLVNQQLPFLGLSLAITLLLAWLGRVPAGVLVGRIGLLLLVALPLLIIVPLTQSEAWPLAIAATCRIVTLGLLALILLRTEPFSRLLAAAHSLGVPRVLLLLVQLAYRYSFVIAAEVRRIRIALRSRGFRIRTDVHSYRTLSYAIGGVLVQSSERADRVSEAMRCRGFTSEYHSLTQFQTRWRDVLGFLVLTMANLAMLALSILT